MTANALRQAAACTVRSEQLYRQSMGHADLRERREIIDDAVAQAVLGARFLLEVAIAHGRKPADILALVTGEPRIDDE